MPKEKQISSKIFPGLVMSVLGNTTQLNHEGCDFQPLPEHKPGSPDTGAWMIFLPFL